MHDWACPDAAPRCSADRLCEGCFGRELTAKRGQAGVAGAVWAEQVAAQHPEVRQHEVWPDGLGSLAAARRRIGTLAKDPRLVEYLAKACVIGAASWWARRPERYR